MVLKIIQSKLPQDTHVEDKVGSGYRHTVPDIETERHSANRKKSSIGLQVLHIFEMKRSSPAPEHKLFLK